MSNKQTRTTLYFANQTEKKKKKHTAIFALKQRQRTEKTTTRGKKELTDKSGRKIAKLDNIRGIEFQKRNCFDSIG